MVVDWQAENSLYRFLDTVGDGSGTKNAISDYNTTPASIKITPPAGEFYSLTRLIVQIRDNAVLAAENYGGISELTNGIEVKVKNAAGDVLDLTDGVPVKSNADWGRQCFDVMLTDWSSGDNFIEVRWTFAKSGKALELNSLSGEWLDVAFSDDLSALVGHYFMVQGFRNPV